MDIRYYLDDHTNQPHMFSHGVSCDEAEEVLRRPLENLPGTRDSRIVIGRTRAGRILKVICVPDAEGDGIFVITAFDLEGKPLRAHNRRMRRRGTR